MNTATTECITNGNTTLSVKLPPEYDDHEMSYFVAHDYSGALSSDNTDGSQRFTINIVGSTYWGIRSNKNGLNIISRVWDLDLPFSDNCSNIASFCTDNERLLRVNIPAYFPAIYKL